MNHCVTLLVVLACFGIRNELLAQSEWQMEGGRMRAAVITTDAAAATRTSTQLTPGKQVTIAAGEAQVHFPSNRAGKPLSLQFSTRANARVNIGIVAESAVASSPLQPFGEHGFKDALVTKTREEPIHVVTIADRDPVMRDYRTSATVSATDGATMFGLVARHNQRHGCYLFSMDWQAHKLRLERWMGGHHMIVRELEAPWFSTRHTLSMQVEGFRLQCAVDDEVVLQSFDGALGGGSPGVAWLGNKPEIGPLQLEPVAKMLASIAVVQEGLRARVHAAVPVAPGHIYVLELALDRPHPWVPRSPLGLEPSLMQPRAAPTILWGDWRNSLGQNVIGEVSNDGTVTCELLLPDLTALRAQTALVRLLLVSPDGEAVVAVTPSVRLIF